MSVTREYRIVVGIGRDEDGEVIRDNDAFDALRNIRRIAATMFGGFTITQSLGGWLADDGELVTEVGRVITIATHHPASVVQEFARYACQELNQACVLLTHPDNIVESLGRESLDDQWGGCDISESRPIYDGHG